MTLIKRSVVRDIKINRLDKHISLTIGDTEVILTLDQAQNLSDLIKSSLIVAPASGQTLDERGFFDKGAVPEPGRKTY